MQKWEYLSFARVAGSWTDDKYDGRSTQEKLSDYGLEGWELISVCYDSSGYNFYCKRPLAPRKTTATKKPKSTTKTTKK
jgi:hypothetical protein